MSRRPALCLACWLLGWGCRAEPGAGVALLHRADETAARLENQLLTPPLSAGALYGITRSVVLELAREAGLAVSEPNLTRYDLFNADECFLTGTGAEVIPVVNIDGRVIGAGRPGPVTKSLVAQYKALTKISGEPIYQP